MLRIIQKRNYWFALSGIILVLAIFSLMTWHLKLGLDFTGGSMMEVSFDTTRPDVNTIKSILDPLELGSLIVQPMGDKSLVLRFQDTSETKHQEVLKKLNELVSPEAVNDKPKVEISGSKDSGVIVSTGSSNNIEELRYNAVGPTVGKELRSKSVTAVTLVIIAILCYIAYAFRKISKPVASWKYATAAIIAVLHDGIITLGVIAVIGKFLNIEVDTSFIVAVLTVLGFSVHDTIVVFDRIRENLPRSNENFENTVNTSINRTLARSINTTLSTLLALLAIIIWGGASIKGFAVVLFVGFLFGAYSSIFLASPMLVVWDKITRKA